MARKRRWMTEEELREHVEGLARDGNMPACRFLWETWLRPDAEGVKPDGIDPLAEVDELARRRRGA